MSSARLFQDPQGLRKLNISPLIVLSITSNWRIETKYHSARPAVEVSLQETEEKHKYKQFILLCYAPLITWCSQMDRHDLFAICSDMNEWIKIDS